eukprot:GAHX01002248.1.p1 GENE.GAHX01002248.1~~GAHX01002248.1.p1  ORF type:complete len:744 (-),score=144.31 GAHX01002248.1:56-2287(-)
MIKSVGIVTFDVKVGQKIEIVEPSDSLTTKEKDTISSLAIPENTAIKGNAVLKYYFTFYSGERKYLKKHYCYVYFVQKKDLTLPRNYLQKSLFIVSPYFIPSLFLTVLNKVSKLLFRTKNLNLEDLETNELLQDNLVIEDTNPLIESAYNALSKWSAPNFKHGKVELPFLGSLIEYSNIYFNLYSNHITLNSYLCLSEYFLSRNHSGSYYGFKRLMYNNLTTPLAETGANSHSWPNRIFSSLKSSWEDYWGEEKHLNIQRFLSYSNFDSSPIIKNIFKNNFKQLLHLWQLVLTGKSILIIAPNPSICSEIATFLSSLILPLDPGFDFLPYVNNMYGEFEDIKYLQEFKVFLYKIVGCTSVFYASILDQFDCVVFIKDETKCIKIHKAEYEIKEVLQSLMNVFNPFSNKTSNNRKSDSHTKRPSMKVDENKNGIYYRPSCRPIWSAFYNSADDILKTSKDLFMHLNKHKKTESESFMQNTMLIFQKLTLNSLKPFFSYFGYYPIINSYFNCFNMFVSKYSNRKLSDENLFEVLKGKFVKKKIDQRETQNKHFFESFEKYFDKCFIYIINLSVPEFKKKSFLKYMSRAENLADLKFSKDYMFVNKKKAMSAECHYYKLEDNIKYVNSTERVGFKLNKREGDVYSFYKDFVGSENFYSWFSKYQKFTFVETYKLYCQKVAELTISFDITLLENFSFMFLLNRLENNYKLIEAFEDIEPNLKSVSLKKLKKLIVSIKDISSMDSVSY